MLWVSYVFVPRFYILIWQILSPALFLAFCNQQHAYNLFGCFFSSGFLLFPISSNQNWNAIIGANSWSSSQAFSLWIIPKEDKESPITAEALLFSQPIGLHIFIPLFSPQPQLIKLYFILLSHLRVIYCLPNYVYFTRLLLLYTLHNYVDLVFTIYQHDQLLTTQSFFYQIRL